MQIPHAIYVKAFADGVPVYRIFGGVRTQVISLEEFTYPHATFEF